MTKLLNSLLTLFFLIALVKPTTSQSCFCWSNRECINNPSCPNTCVLDWRTNQRRCADQSPTAVPPSPTRRPLPAPTRRPLPAPTRRPVPAPTRRPVPSPVPAPNGNGLGALQAVPSVCQVAELIDLMDRAVQINKAIAPQWLRLAFHDAGTFNRQVPEGGANGCLLNDESMRQMPENHNLDLAIETLRVIKAQMVNNPIPIRLSSADLTQFAGFFVAVRQRGTPGMNQEKKTELINRFQWGRPDERNCDVSWTLNLPGFELGADETSIPQRCLFAGTEIREKMMDRNGFTAREAAVLIGAHTIGETRNVFGPDEAGPWQRNGADDATTEGPIFDNGFHRFLVNSLSAKTVDRFSRVRFPFNQDFPTWFRSTPIDVNHLDTDIVLAFPSQDTNVHPHFNTFSEEFARSNTVFINTFMDALTKMSQLGVRIPLFVATNTCAQRLIGLPPPQSPDSPSSPARTNFDNLLLASIATADDLLDQTRQEREEEINVLTTPVTNAGP